MSKKFKVGDKVSHPMWGNGVVAETSGSGMVAVSVIFRGVTKTIYFTRDGRYFEQDIAPSLHHGHGTFEIRFTPEPEPVYEWQWKVRSKADGYMNYSAHYKSEKDLLEDSCYQQSSWEIVERDESTKREVKP